MRTFNKNQITAAFTQVARLVERGEFVATSKLGLSANTAQTFRKAITHTFKKDVDGFDLQKIFSVDKDNPNKWTRCSAPNNPKDITLVDKIIEAMSYVNKQKKASKKEKVVKETIIKEKVSPAIEFLISTFEQNGHTIELIARIK